MEGPGNVVIEKETYKDQLDELKSWAKAGKSDGTEFWMQISHAGRQTPASISKEPFAPSSVQLKIPGKAYGIPKAMTAEDIQSMQSATTELSDDELEGVAGGICAATANYTQEDCMW